MNMNVIRVWSVVISLCGILSFTRGYTTSRKVVTSFSETDFVEVLHKHSTPKSNHKNAPPQYMLDLYNQIADDKGVTKSPLPHGASVVRAVPNQGEAGGSMVFPLYNIPNEEETIEGEFHVFHRQLKFEERKKVHGIYKLLLYQEHSQGVTLLSTHELTSHYSGWRIFSVGSVVKEARRLGLSSIGFHLKVTTHDGIPLQIDIHKNHGSKSPLLVLFNKADNKVPKMLLTKSNTQSKEHRHKRSTDSLPMQNQNTPANSTSDGCVLTPMVVNFEDIGWASWIVFPYEYNAHQCVGACAFPLGQHLNPSNHATVQSILQHSETKDGIQHPSCVPTEYASLTLLYYDGEDNVVLKQFDHMIAKQCGCR